MNLGNWNTGIMSTACVVFGLVLGFLVGGLFAPPVAGDPWLKTYQGLVAALLGLSAAGLGLAVATRDVLQDEIVQIYTQLRLHAVLIASLQGRAVDNQVAFGLVVVKERFG